MRLRAKGNINSGQYNAGDEFDAAEAEALVLIEAGAAEAVDGATPAVEQEANVTEAPLAEVPVGSDSPEENPPLAETTLEIQPLEVTPPLENEGMQPSDQQIAKDLQTLDSPSEASQPDIHLS